MPVPVDPGVAVAHTPITASGLNARFAPLFNTLNPASIGIDDSNIKANALTAASLALGPTLIATPQAWQTVALGGGGTWTPANLWYYKDSLGIVHLRGDQSSFTGTVSGGATLATLPAGYRPVNTQGFTIVRRDGVAPQPIEITSAGVVSTVNGLAAGVLYSFGLVHFRAEN